MINRWRDHDSSVDLAKQIEIGQERQVVERAAIRDNYLHSPSLGIVVIAPPPEQLEILLIKFYAESNAAPPREIQKLDAREPNHRRFSGGNYVDPIVSLPPSIPRVRQIFQQSA
jgi:hypothetical protein